MDFALLPHVSVAGRIANGVRLRKTRNGAKYVQLLIYMYHHQHAKLMPMMAFNKVAKKIVDEAQQGDLLLLHARIDPLRNGRYINPTLFVSEFSHLESEAIRNVYHGKSGKELRALFPVTPENYPKRTAKKKIKGHKKSHKIAKSEKPKPKSKTKAKPKHSVQHVKSSDVTVLPSKNDFKHKNKKKRHNPLKTNTDWVKEAEKLTDFDFPDLH